MGTYICVCMCGVGAVLLDVRMVQSVVEKGCV